MTTPVPGITGTIPTAGTTTPTTATQKTTGTSSLLDPQAFLQLLVAQLKYQDPTSPTDTSTFMNQTAMLSQVQSMGSMSSTLTSLAEAQQAQSATSMIGKQITWSDANGVRTSGVVTSANLAATGATLLVGDQTVPLSGVLAVASAPATPTT